LEEVGSDGFLGREAIPPHGLGTLERLLVGGPLGGPAGRPRIGETIVVLVVAEDRRAHRLALEESLPEALGKLVDGTRGRSDGHAGVLLVGGSLVRNRGSCSPDVSISGSRPRSGRMASRLASSSSTRRRR